MATREGKAYGLPVGQYVVSQLGGKWTPEKAKFFGAWAQAEGTAAEYNPFATTRRGFPSTQFNEVGVKNFPNLAIGQRATLETLKNGYYDDIVSLLKDPNSTAEQLASAVSASPWGTGTGVLRVLGAKGATAYEQTSSRQKWAAKKATVNAPSEAFTPMQQSLLDYNANIQAQQDIAARLRESTAPLLTPSAGWLKTLERMGSGGTRLAQAASSPMPTRMPAPAFVEAPQPQAVPEATPTTQAPGGGFVPSGNVKKVKPVGGLLVTSRGWKETPHAGGHTGGLPEFTQPADLPGAPGKPIGAPTSGVITKIGSAQEGGQSYYITGDDGYEYWLGHIDTRLSVGTRVKANQIIATISGEHPRPHLHIDRRKL